MLGRSRRVECLGWGALALALGCSEAAGLGSDGEELGTRRAPLVNGATLTLDLPVVISEYQFPPSLDPLVHPIFETELWASVYRPEVLEQGRRYPLLLLMHGNHGTCGRGASPRRDDNVQYSFLGTCAEGSVVVQNHRGLDYLGEDLAARGYLVVSINTNRGINGVPSPDPGADRYAIEPRAHLLLRHLELLSHWDAGSEATPAELGVDLTDHIDFSEVGLLGHSRGGEGVRLAYEAYGRSDSPWPGLIQSPVDFRGIFEIAPTDEPVYGALINAHGTAWNVLLPACDWDLRDLPGVRPFDRMLNLGVSGAQEQTALSKSFYHVWGANHNYYNSEWQVPDAGGGGTITGCLNHAPLFNPSDFGSAEQRETGRFAAAAFFMANVGAERVAAGEAVFDPAIPLPVSYRVNRGYHPGGEIAFGDAADDDAFSLVLEDFLNPTGESSYGLPNDTSGGLSVQHTELTDHHDASLSVGLIEDIVPSPSTFFQSNWAPVGAGFDLATYDYLSLRVDRTTSETTSAPVSFLVELVNGDDSRSGPVAIDELLPLLPPPRAITGRTLQTVRIPLGAFEGAQLEAIRGARLTFTTPIEAGILVANLRATRNATTVPSPLPPIAAPAVAGGVPTTLSRLGAETASAFEPERVGAGNRIMSVASQDSQSVEITLTTSRVFELRPRALRLSIGGATSSRALHPNGDLHSVKFSLSRDAFERLQARERVRVDYGSDSDSPVVWDFGMLDKARLDR